MHQVCVGDCHFIGMVTSHVTPGFPWLWSPLMSCPVPHGYRWSHIVSTGHRMSNVVIKVPVAMRELSLCVMTHPVSMVMQMKGQRKSRQIVGDITSGLPQQV
jgi:hypothetical protein